MFEHFGTGILDLGKAPKDLSHLQIKAVADSMYMSKSRSPKWMVSFVVFQANLRRARRFLRQLLSRKFRAFFREGVVTMQPALPPREQIASQDLANPPRVCG